MRRRMLHLPDGTTVEMEREVHEVTMLRRPDEHWQHVDPSGHVHRWFVNSKPATTYDHRARYELPTLEEIIDVEGSEPDADDYYPSITHHECRICRAHVEPGYTADHARQYIAGLTYYRINGEPATQEQMDELRAKWFPDDAA